MSRLRIWRSSYRGRVTVVFDRGIVGGASRELSGGGVEVIFARNPQEADDLIRRRIHRRPQGLIVVTNDRTLRQEAELYDIETWQADEFVRRMENRGGQTARPLGDASSPGSGSPSAIDQDETLIDEGAESHVNLSEREVSEWLDTFGPSKPEEQPPQKIERGAPSRSRAAFSRDKDALKKRLKGKQRKR